MEASARAQESLLNTIIESEEVGLALKGVFEAEKEEECLNALNVFISEKDKEIQDVCNFHYQVSSLSHLFPPQNSHAFSQDFAHSVDELLEVKKGSDALQNKVTEVNSKLQETGSQLLKKARALYVYRARYFVFSLCTLCAV